MSTRKKDSKEFKLDAISRILEQNSPHVEAAKNIVINATMLGHWVKEYQSDDGQAFRGNVKLTPEQLEIQQLKNRVKCLEMEKAILKKDDILCQRNEVKYSFIAQQKNTRPIDLMCQTLGVKRSGYYRFQKNQLLKPNYPKHADMLDLVKKIAKESRYSYDSRRIKHALNALGYPVSRSKARKLMKEASVRTCYRKKYKVTTNSNHKYPVNDNVLNRQFTVEQSNQAYVSDITYIWTQKDGSIWRL